jgi:hypothetical protein
MIELVHDVKSSLFLSCQKSSRIQDFTADPQRDAQRERERECIQNVPEYVCARRSFLPQTCAR